MMYLSPTNIRVETIQNIYVINPNQAPPPEQETSPGPAPSVCLSQLFKRPGLGMTCASRSTGAAELSTTRHSGDGAGMYFRHHASPQRSVDSQQKT